MGDDANKDARGRLVEDRLILERHGRNERRIGWSLIGVGAVLLIGSTIVSFLGSWVGVGGGLIGGSLVPLLAGILWLREGKKTLAFDREQAGMTDEAPSQGAE
ncbi:hypothetical protein [Cryobacterium tepidiphilum]|uniref:DUF3040 domain-containing protein n=1 Tax=Cryobacterium tepidiphilum TaxID=2486026 RepID=A0A3M8LEX0_9MICO|nr:hypothetical protein [Cryobacterium tepidiphilum]RNE64011.1 hypothetical protein EEJ31_05450 [Cryobacterium tepidiphilum]